MLPILAALGFGLGLFLAPPPPGPANVTRETLPNGLDVLVEERAGTATVAVRVYVKTGSVNEEPFLGAGISHLYEHLLAGGTTSTRTEKQADDILRTIGASMNAYTTYDVTCYHITTAGEHAGTAIELLADWMRNNVLDPREVARETEVVQRELEKDEDEPANVLWRVHMEEAYRKSPIRLPVIGYKQNIQRITRDDLVRFYKERYAPNNAVLVVVGDVRAPAVLERVRAAFGPWERRTLRANVLPSEPAQVSPRRAERAMPVGVSLVKVGWPSVDLLSPDLYALDVLAFVLGQGDASVLRRELVDERKLATGVSVSSWTPSFGAGQFMIDLEVADGSKLEAAIEALREVRLEWASAGERLARAKTQKVSEYVFATEKNEGRAESVAQDWIGTGDPFFSEKYVERIQAVTVADLERVAKAYLRAERVTVSVVRPAVAASPNSATSTSTSTSTKVGPRKILLESGLTVVLLPMEGAKSVAIDAFFAGGVRGETRETNGLMQMLARTMVRGTSSRDAQKLAADVDALGATLRPEAGYQSIGLSGSFLERDLDRGLALVADVLAHPTFAEAEIARERRVLLAEIAAEDDDWQAEGVTLFREALFGKHPYATRPKGTPGAVERVDRAALVAAWKGTVHPRNGVLAVAGGFDPAAAEAAVRKHFAAFVAQGPVAASIPEPPPALAEGREVVKKTGKGQTTIVLGYPGLSVESGDRFAVDVIDAVTSGVGLPSGWLHEALRGGEQSLVYFVHAIPWYGVEAGAYYILTRCNPADEAKVLDLVRAAQRRIVETELADEDLAKGKSIAATAQRIGRETPAERARQAALDELLGLGWEWSERYAERVKAVTKADVARVARRIFGGPSILARVRPEGAPEAPPPAKPDHLEER